MHVNSEYQSFEYKTNVVNEEIGAFLEVIGAFHALTELMNNNRNRQKELKRELEEVVSNPQLIYGVVKKTTKDEKINKLKYKHENSVKDSEVCEELYSIIASFISEIEMPNFKLNHSRKWNFLLNRLAEERMKRIKSEENFWESLAEFTSTS